MFQPKSLPLLAITLVISAACASPPVPAPAAPDAYAPIAALNELDTRTPLPLQAMMAWHQKQNMQQHLVAIQRITGALANNDWDEVIAASALIASSPQMQQMCTHMGAGAEGFTERALAFHQRADHIAVAAKAQDRSAVLQATSDTLQACTGCHATYHQQVVSAEEWQRRTGSDAAPMGMPHMP